MVPIGMIETWEIFDAFIESSKNDDLLLHVVPLHDGIHSAINSPSLLFIRNLATKRTYYYAFDHPDVRTPKPIDHARLISALSSTTGLKWAVDKKSFEHMVPIRGLLDVGFAEYVRANEVFEVGDFETPAHVLVRRNFSGRPGYGKFVPLMKHLEAFSELAETCEKIIKKAVVDDAMIAFNRLIIEPLGETEKHGLQVDLGEFRSHFGDILVKSGKVYSQYFFYTSTGRPSNRFGGVNYAALNKDDGSRKSFVSRFGENGRLVLIDYSSFHPRILGFLTDYQLPLDVDIYEYLAKLYFNKTKVDEIDIADAKQITFRQFFGGVEEKYQHIKYLSHMKSFIDHHWRFFKEHGYVETPFFKRKITEKHIGEPKPATVFNYIMQASEGEISIPVLQQVNEFLKDKQSKAVLYTYDSILFDCCLDDGPIMGKVRTMMSLENRFPMKTYLGDNYHDMHLLT